MTDEANIRLANELGYALWIAQLGKDESLTSDERRDLWMEKKSEYVPLGRRMLRILDRRGFALTRVTESVED